VRVRVLEDRNRYNVEGTVDEINALMINKGGKAIPVPMDLLVKRLPNLLHIFNISALTTFFTSVECS